MQRGCMYLVVSVADSANTEQVAVTANFIPVEQAESDAQLLRSWGCCCTWKDHVTEITTPCLTRSCDRQLHSESGGTDESLEACASHRFTLLRCTHVMTLMASSRHVQGLEMLVSHAYPLPTVISVSH